MNKVISFVLIGRKVDAIRKRRKSSLAQQAIYSAQEEKDEQDSPSVPRLKKAPSLYHSGSQRSPKVSTHSRISRKVSQVSMDRQVYLLM